MNDQAIAHLELDLDYHTEVIGRHRMEVEPGDNLIEVTYRGATRQDGARCNRPMFEILRTSTEGDLRRSGSPQTPCPNCGNFAYSWKCDDHDNGEDADFDEDYEEDADDYYFEPA